MDEIIKRLLENDPTLTRFSFSADTIWGLDAELFAKLMKAIRENQILTSFSLHSGVKEGSTREYGLMMIDETNIDRFVLITQAVAENRTITSFNFGAICDPFCHLGRTQSYLPSLKAILERDTLCSLCLAGNCLTDDSIVILAKVIAEHKTLTSLDLEYNLLDMLDVPLFEMLMGAIGKNRSLTSLNLNTNFFRDLDLVRFAMLTKTIAENRALISLNISFSNRDDERVDNLDAGRFGMFLNALRANPNILRISTDLSPERTKAIQEILTLNMLNMTHSTRCAARSLKKVVVKEGLPSKELSSLAIENILTFYNGNVRLHRQVMEREFPGDKLLDEALRAVPVVRDFTPGIMPLIHAFCRGSTSLHTLKIPVGVAAYQTAPRARAGGTSTSSASSSSSSRDHVHGPTLTQIYDRLRTLPVLEHFPILPDVNHLIASYVGNSAKP